MPSIEHSSVLNEKLRPQHNETILLLKYCKLIIEQNERAEEWMGQRKIIANEC